MKTSPRMGRPARTTPVAHSILAALAIFASAGGARADQTVTIGPSISFNPPIVTIAPGERVIWTWAASPHTTTSDATTGADAWDSGIQPTGATFSHLFTTAGTFPYYCQVHSFPGGTLMNGVVQVTGPAITPTPTPTPSVTPLPSPSPTTLGGGAPPTGAIPTLDRKGLVFLAVALALASLALILRSRR